MFCYILDTARMQVKTDNATSHIILLVQHVSQLYLFVEVKSSGGHFSSSQD